MSWCCLQEAFASLYHPMSWYCLQEAFAPLYRRISARKLIFFHGHNGVLRIKDLVGSQTLMAELCELRIPDQTEDQLLGSWFSLQVGYLEGRTFTGGNREEGLHRWELRGDWENLHHEVAVSCSWSHSLVDIAVSTSLLPHCPPDPFPSRPPACTTRSCGWTLRPTGTSTWRSSVRSAGAP